MNSPAPRSWFLRPTFLLWSIGSTLTLVSLFVILGWVVLPRLVPKWVIQHSPFYGPAFLAALQAGAPGYEFVERVEQWRHAALADAAHRLAEPDEKAAGLAIKIVTKLNPPDAARIIAIGIAHPEARVLKDVAYQLQKLNATSYLPALIDALPRHSDPLVFDAALNVAPLLTTEHFQLTARLRTSARPAERALAASLVCRMDHEEALSFIMSQVGQYVADYKPDKLTWDPSMVALARNRSDQAILRLCQELNHPEAQRRLHAIGAIHTQLSWKDERVEGPLLSCFEDVDPKVARYATSVLIQRRTPTALTGLDLLLTKDLPGSALAVPKNYTQVKKERVPVLVRHLLHPKFGEQISTAVLTHVVYHGEHFELVLEQLGKLPFATAKALESSLSIDERNLTDEMNERWKRMKEIIRTSGPRIENGVETAPPLVTPPAPPADQLLPPHGTPSP